MEQELSYPTIRILFQGIGGRMSGLIKTEPIKDVINGIQKFGGIVLDTKTAVIDPAGGVKKLQIFVTKR